MRNYLSGDLTRSVPSSTSTVIREHLSINTRRVPNICPPKIRKASFCGRLGFYESAKYMHRFFIRLIRIPNFPFRFRGFLSCAFCSSQCSRARLLEQEGEFLERASDRPFLQSCSSHICFWRFDGLFKLSRWRNSPDLYSCCALSKGCTVSLIKLPALGIYARSNLLFHVSRSSSNPLLKEDENFMYTRRIKRRALALNY